MSMTSSAFGRASNAEGPGGARLLGGMSVPERARMGDEAEGYTRINVAPSERVLSGIAGTAMVALGLKRGTFGGLALAVAGGFVLYRGVTGYCGLYDALNLDSAHEGHGVLRGMHKGVKVQHTLTINKPVAECFAFWRRLENLPRFMTHLKQVRELDHTRSHWEAKAPMGMSVSWEAEVINERPNELIAWKSVEGSQIDNAGSVRFRPATGGRGTEITVELNYEPPAGRLGRAVASLFGEEPEIQVREDLRGFKALMETGEVPTVEGQPSGRA